MLNLFSKILLVLTICLSVIAQEIDSTKLIISDSSQIVSNVKTAPTNLEELRKELNDIFSDPNFSNAFWGVYIQSLKTGETLFKLNSNKLFIPASLMKLFTTSAAVLLLGSDFRYQTTIYTDGIIQDGILKGNLIIRGTGDPTISNRFVDGKATVVFEQWADSLKAKGIHEIEGNIIGDDDNFDESRYGHGWSFDYENYWFAPPSGALCFNNNSIEVTITPTKPKMPAAMTIDPENNYFKFINRVFTVDDNSKSSIDLIKKRGSNIISLRGAINSKDVPQKFYVSVEDPTQYFVMVLQDVLNKNGIKVTGYPSDKDNEAVNLLEENLTPIFIHYSVPFLDILMETNKNSNNFYAEQILRTVGYELMGYGNIENGVLMCKEIFQKMGINPDNVSIADGSGLSRLDLVTPKQLVNLLSYMHKSDEFVSFYDSLPIAGVDGTLAQRMIKTKAANNLHGKSGFLEGVKTIAGYIKTSDNEPLVFSILVNNFLVPSQLANYLQDKVCNRLANFNRN